MKKNSLTTAVVAGLAGVAGIANISNAVNLNPDGIGQVLVYPYYTVQAGNDTLISVVNTTNTGKAVKVRFLEGRNSREVLDFNLYLSEFDVWTAGVFSLAADGPGNLTTADNSCTVPGIKSSIAVSLPTLANGQRYVPFRNFAYVGTGPGVDDAGPNALSRTREGYIEMLEMGTLEELSDSDIAATHVSGVPVSCPTLEAAWSPGGYWALNAQIDLLPPSGGLYGGGAIVNVSNGTYINYNADALERYSVRIQHTSPGDLLPNLATGTTCTAPAGCVNAAGTVPIAGMESIVFDNGNLIISNWAATVAGRADAVSAVFAYDNLINEYTVEAGIGAKSEWVITFPTKRFYVDPLFIGGSVTATGPGLAPFVTNRFAGSEGNGSACEPIGIAAYNREEARPVGNIDFSPLPPQGFTALCYEAQVVTFNQTGTSQILGATYASNISTSFNGGAFENGWVNINLSGSNHRGRPSLDFDQYEGLPVTGFWALTVANQNAAPGVRGFYGGAFRHRGTRECVNQGGNIANAFGLCPN